MRVLMTRKCQELPDLEDDDKGNEVILKGYARTYLTKKMMTRIYHTLSDKENYDKVIPYAT